MKGDRASVSTCWGTYGTQSSVGGEPTPMIDLYDARGAAVISSSSFIKTSANRSVSS